MKPIREHQELQRLDAYVVLHKRQQAGFIHVLYGKDGGGIVRVDAAFFRGPFRFYPILQGRAGGYGYDKQSAAFQNAMERGNVKEWGKKDAGGTGWNNVEFRLGKLGYKLLKAI